MKLRIPTGSSLERAFNCHASHVLPAAEHTSEAGLRGSALHKYVELCHTMPPSEALQKIPREYRQDCESFDLSWIPEGMESEVAMAWDTATDTARLIGKGIGRNYGKLTGTEIAATADLIAVDGDTVRIADMKSEHSDGITPPAAVNLQLGALAVMACKLHGKDKAVVSLIYPGSHSDTAELSAFDLEVTALTIKRVVDDVRATYAAWKLDGREPEVKSGPWCRYCPSVGACPAKTSLLRALAGNGADVVPGLGAVTPANAAAAWFKVKEVEQLIERVKADLKLYATTTPVDLGDGWWLGQIEKSEESIDAKAARVYLADRFSAEVADGAVKMTCTKSAIEEIARVESQKAGGKRGALKALHDEMMDALRKRNAVKTSAWTSVQAFKRRT